MFYVLLTSALSADIFTCISTYLSIPFFCNFFQPKTAISLFAILLTFSHISFKVSSYVLIPPLTNSLLQYSKSRIRARFEPTRVRSNGLRLYCLYLLLQYCSSVHHFFSESVNKHRATICGCWGTMPLEVLYGDNWSCIFFSTCSSRNP